MSQTRVSPGSAQLIPVAIGQAECHSIAATLQVGYRKWDIWGDMHVTGGSEVTERFL